MPRDFCHRPTRQIYANPLRICQPQTNLNLQSIFFLKYKFSLTRNPRHPLGLGFGGISATTPGKHLRGCKTTHFETPKGRRINAKCQKTNTPLDHHLYIYFFFIGLCKFVKETCWIRLWIRPVFIFLANKNRSKAHGSCTGDLHRKWVCSTYHQSRQWPPMLDSKILESHFQKIVKYIRRRY